MLRDFYNQNEILNLDNYYIKEIISHNPFSYVFLAIDLQANKEVALKLFEIQQKETDHFIQAIITLKYLNLPGICHIYEFSFLNNKAIIRNTFNVIINEDKKTRYFIITEEFMKYGDVDKIMTDYINNKSKCKLNINPTIRNKIIFGVASIMKSLHQNHLLHCNLTTFHVLLNEKFEPKISISYHSKAFNEKQDDFLSKCAFNYMAPELIIKKPYSYPIDVYSFSIFLYRMFSNSFKFSNGFPMNRFSFLNRIVKGERLKRPQNIPDDFWEMIQRCWNQNPCKRPTFVDIVEDLKNDRFALEEFGMKSDLDELHRYQLEIEKETQSIPEQLSLTMSLLVCQSQI